MTDRPASSVDQKLTTIVRGLRDELPPGTVAIRPRDAATLIMFRRRRDGAEVLMGRRHASHKFMPNTFVFPGGRVDPTDARVLPQLALAPDAAAPIARIKGAMRARAIGLAAIRETFEEAGIVIGHPLDRATPATKNPAWKAFLQSGHLPALGALRLLARAITPPVQPKRFDTFFFSVDIDDVPAAATPVTAGSGELEELQWVRLDDTDRLGLMPVTVFALEALGLYLTTGSAPVRFIHFRRGKYYIDEL